MSGTQTEQAQMQSSTAFAARLRRGRFGNPRSRPVNPLPVTWVRVHSTGISEGMCRSVAAAYDGLGDRVKSECQKLRTRDRFFGWHNNHHAYQRSAPHVLLWWEVDPRYLSILVLSLLGLAKDIHGAPKPSPAPRPGLQCWRILFPRKRSRQAKELATANRGGAEENNEVLVH
jgi:hypothetical protein